MLLYDITVFISDSGFSVATMTSDVILYEKNGQCKASRFNHERTFNSNELDKYKTGLLSSNIPQVSIETIGREAIDKYIEEMKKMITSELNERLNRTQEQLDLIENKSHH